MFLNKKEYDFLKLIKSNGNKSLYKVARKLFSTVTITKKIKQLIKDEVVEVELIGRINNFKFTPKGEEILNHMNKIFELSHFKK